MQQTVVVQSGCRIRQRLSSLVLSSQSASLQIPLADIWSVILEDQTSTISVSAISSITGHGIPVIVCGANHMPCSINLPLGLNTRIASVVQAQLAMPKPFQKRIWQRMVMAKIENQARVLDVLGLGGDRLRKIARETRSGDTTGRESVAAQIYFHALLGDGTRRNSTYTAVPDYGYSIVRAGIGRHLVSAGWIPAIGIHHHSVLNPFNLVDDFLEPFRPLVDLLVFTNGLHEPLTKEMRLQLASVSEYVMCIDGDEYSLQSAIAEVVHSFKRAVSAGDASILSVPELCDLKKSSIE